MSQKAKVILVRTVDDFDSAISEIVKTRRPIVFRGQVSDRPLTASFFRGNAPRKASGCVPYLTVNWSNYCKKLLTSSMGNNTKIDFIPLANLALMQHYGYRSFFVDVTEDPEIALWFALNKFVKKTVPIYIDPLKLRSAKITWAYYQPVSSGFIYVLWVDEELADKRYNPLTKLMPSFATRVFRQKSGAINCIREKNGANELVLCKIQISDSDKDLIERAKKYTTKFLFPPPTEDRLYKCLCTIPYYVPTSYEMENVQFAEPILPIPLFADSIRDLVRDYMPLIRILSGERVAYEWNVTQAKTIVNGNQYFGEHAHRILVSTLEPESIKKAIQKSSPVNFGVWPSNNIVIEFDLDASLLVPSDEPVNSLLRGLWVVMGKTELGVSRIVDTLNGIVLERPQIHNLSEKNIISRTFKFEALSDEIQTFCLLSKGLELGELKLKKEKFGYWRLISKDEI